MKEISYVSTKNQTYIKKDKCKSDLCSHFKCISKSDSCGRDCMEAQYLCKVCMVKRTCDPNIVKKYIGLMVKDMVSKDKDRTFSAIEVTGEQLVEIHVIHEYYQRSLTEVRRKISESSGLSKYLSGRGLVNEGFDLKLKIEELRKYMDILGIEYEEKVSLKPQY